MLVLIVNELELVPIVVVDVSNERDFRSLDN